MALEALPNELLDMIVEGVAPCAGGSSALKAIRLVNKRMSTMPAVLSNLFRYIRLVADPDLRARFTAPAFRQSGLAAYVRHVTFVPPLHALLTLSDFMDIFKDQKEHGYGCYAPDSAKSSTGKRRTNKTSSHARNLHSDERLREGYNEYYANALRSFSYLADESDDLEVWLDSMLSQMPKCASFKFDAVDFNMVGVGFKPMFPHCLWSPRLSALAMQEDIASGGGSGNSSREPSTALKPWVHHETTARCEWHADLDMAAVIADDFAKRVIAFLSSHKIRIEELHFCQVTTHAYEGWRTILDLYRLNLRGLRAMTIAPCMPSDDQHMRRHRIWEDMEYLCSRAAPTLEALHCAGVAFIVSSTIVLPRLRTLILRRCEATQSSIGRWVETMEGLECMKLHNIHAVNDQRLEAWYPFLRMLLQHRTLSQASLQLINAKQDAQLVCKFVKADTASGVGKMPEDLRMLGAVDLFAHLSLGHNWCSNFALSLVKIT